MSEKLFSYEDVLAALKAAVEERGEDWVYPSDWGDDYADDDWHTRDGLCVYRTPDGTPACIIGVAFDRLDPVLAPDYDHVVSAHRLVEAMRNRFVEADVERIKALVLDVQGRQDSGEPWGSALRAALDNLTKAEEGNR